MNDSRETIFALSSGVGRAGIAVFRLSGSGVQAVAAKLTGDLPEPRKAALRALRGGNGDIIDQAVVIWLPGPASFTGEDMAEFHVHGSPAVIQRLADELAKNPGCRPAEAGEFARRAFEAGKLDLAEIEGIADLVDADTEFQRRQAVRQMGGAQSRIFDDWRQRIIRALALVEAYLDFPEDDDIEDRDLVAAMRGDMAAVDEELTTFLDDSHQGERLRRGVSVVIAGAPNAGKSTLLNAIARCDAAIVSKTAGTTRDIIQVDLDLGGYPLTLVDTAGLREAGDDIEREGIARAESALAAADIVLFLQAPDDAGNPVPDTVIQAPVHLVIHTKQDLAGTPAVPDGALGISVHAGQGMNRLESFLEEKAGALCGTGDAAHITRLRHRNALEAARDALGEFLQDEAAGPEISAEHLRRAAAQIGRITGRVDVEDLLDVVFSELCIGK